MIAFQCCVMLFALGVIMLAIRRSYAILWRACSWMSASLRFSWNIQLSESLDSCGNKTGSCRGFC